MATVELFWEPGSPYTYLAATQIAAFERDTGATVVWKPFLLGKVFQARGMSLPASIPAKAQYMFKDLARWAQLYQVPLTMPKVFPVNSMLASRVSVAAGQQGKGAEAALAVMGAYWGQGHDISQPDVIKAALAGAGAQLHYAGKRGGKPSAKQGDISDKLIDLARSQRKVLRLKGGDPFIFGRGGEEGQTLVQHNVPIRIIPGISAGIGGLAYAGIPVTHRDVNQAVTFVTGHDRTGNASGVDWASVAKGSGVIVIYMGMKHLAAIAADVVDLYEPLAEDANAELSLDAPQSLTVVASRELIAQALSNLVDNALKYATDPERKTRIRVTLSEGGGAWSLAVSDDGPGIPPAQREEALRPFVRLDPARNQDRGSGVGLGLAIAADIARGHGGVLRLGQSDRLGGLCADIVIAR